MAQVNELANELKPAAVQQIFFDELCPNFAAVLADFGIAVPGQVNQIKILDGGGLRNFQRRLEKINRLRLARGLRSAGEILSVRQRINQRRFADVRPADEGDFRQHFRGVLRAPDGGRHVFALDDFVNFIFHSAKDYSIFRGDCGRIGERNFGDDALKSFREIYRRIGLLTGAGIEKINLRDVFDYPPEENIDGFIVYAYVDAETGLNFKILAGAQLDDTKIKIVPGSYKRNKNLRRAEIAAADIKILPESFAAAFKDKIQVVDDAFAFDAGREQTRLVKTIDHLRHPDFPDDVAVIFHGENFTPEQGWVRCKAVDGNLIGGVLIHELQQAFGYHAGDAVTFGVVDFEGEIICAVIDK